MDHHTFFLGKAKSAKRYFGCKYGVTSKLSFGRVAKGGEMREGESV